MLQREQSLTKSSVAVVYSCNCQRNNGIDTQRNFRLKSAALVTLKHHVVIQVADRLNSRFGLNLMQIVSISQKSYNYRIGLYIY